MAAANRTDKIKQLFKILQKRYKHVPKPPDRNILSLLMFSACLENAPFDVAEAAFSVLEHHYIDWNEIRVSTPHELADTLPMLPNPQAAGERLKKTLQWVFETTYMFDLEEFKKRNISQAIEYFESVPYCTPFMRNYTIQIGLDGHQIPLDEAAMRILRRLDLTKVSDEGDKEEAPALERTITKNQGVDFAMLMHLLGVEFYEKPDAPELLTLLKGIESGAEKRSWTAPELVVKKAFPKLPVKKMPLPAKSFVPAFALDDDEIDEIEVIPASPEESIEFIDHGLVQLQGKPQTLFDLQKPKNPEPEPQSEVKEKVQLKESSLIPPKTTPAKKEACKEEKDGKKDEKKNEPKPVDEKPDQQKPKTPEKVAPVVPVVKKDAETSKNVEVTKKTVKKSEPPKPISKPTKGSPQKKVEPAPSKGKKTEPPAKNLQKKGATSPAPTKKTPPQEKLSPTKKLQKKKPR